MRDAIGAVGDVEAAAGAARATAGGGRLEEEADGGGGGVGFLGNAGKCEGVGGPETGGGVGMDLACSGCGCCGLAFCFFFCG